ncbi:hypothetical protein ABE65_017715 [Fictibacillus phosphorivorans]|uniref:Uncharacterized protein n=1 Tax=Fictibacillus phosphorivorans TaxID=1221500 RepID=A0A160IQP9_9BACL|nr:hypothetical protein [Fictibacillus phosphorivorans]ANC78537.1 hypothetical protein ABE65_017715 [Fictibacillus phosphorivorans]
MKKLIFFALISMLLIGYYIYYSSYPISKGLNNKQITNSIEDFYNNNEESKIKINKLVEDTSFGKHEERIILFTTKNDLQGYTQLEKNILGRYKIKFVALNNSEFEYNHIETSDGPYFLIYGRNNKDINSIKIPIKYSLDNEKKIYNLENEIKVKPENAYYFSVRSLPKKVENSYMDSNEFAKLNPTLFK